MSIMDLIWHIMVGSLGASITVVLILLHKRVTYLEKTIVALMQPHKVESRRQVISGSGSHEGNSQPEVDPSIMPTA